MIWVRRWRSISFWTKLLGTDSSAKPSAIVRGLTSVNQARCWGVSGGVVGSAAGSSGPSGLSPLSSATTVFHTAANGAPGSAVNDENPLFSSVEGRQTKTMTSCPHSYPQVWTGQRLASLSLGVSLWTEI